MAEKVRLNLQVSSELNRVLEEIVDDTGSTRSDVIRQALALIKVAHEGKGGTSSWSGHRSQET
jgi:predicted transcriptional regulator